MQWSCTETTFRRYFRERGKKRENRKDGHRLAFPLFPFPIQESVAEKILSHHVDGPPGWNLTTVAFFHDRIRAFVRRSHVFRARLDVTCRDSTPVAHRFSRSSIVFVTCPSLLPSHQEKLLSPPLRPTPKQKKNKKRGEKGVPAMFFFRFFRFDRPRVV